MGTLSLPACNAGGGTNEDGGSTATGSTSAGADSSTGAVSAADDTAGTSGGQSEESGSGGVSGSTSGASSGADSTGGTTADTGGDSTGGGDPATLVGAEWVDFGTVRLTFSEPIMDVSDVQPQQFRLSWAITNDAMGPMTTYYSDLGYWDTEILMNPTVGIMNDPDDAAVLLMTLTRPISQTVCNYMGAYKDIWPTAENSAVYVHYTKNGIPEGTPVVDESGDELENIGAAFAEITDQYMGEAEGQFPNMSSPISMPCPHEA